MKLRLRKIIKQIKAHQFGQPERVAYTMPDPGDRRRAHAPMCVR
jgi:hypothetical protein